MKCQECGADNAQDYWKQYGSVSNFGDWTGTAVTEPKVHHALCDACALGILGVAWK